MVIVNLPVAALPPVRPHVIVAIGFYGA